MQLRGRREDLGPDTKLVYRHFATLYFCILSDRSESELAMLDLIQVYVETLTGCSRTCELDLIFNSPKAHTVLDETIVGGLVLEINSQKILGVYDNLMKLEKAHDAAPISWCECRKGLVGTGKHRGIGEPPTCS